MAKKVVPLRQRRVADMEEGRQRDALALGQATPEPTPPAPTAPEAPAVVHAPRTPTRRGATTSRITVYFAADGILEDARRAYIAQLDHANPQTSFARWLSALLEEHAARTPEQRDQIAKNLDQLDRTDPPAGASRGRAFDVYDTSLELADDAIRVDRAHRPAPSRSSFAVEALREATRTIREANGGQLPPAPKRLPNQPQVD